MSQSAARDPLATTPALHVADRLHALAIHLLRHVRREDVASGISAAQLSALSVVVHAGPTPLGDLASAEQVSAPTMSRLVNALERAGLASRHADPQDRRVVRVEATAEGKRILREGRARRVQVLAEYLRDLSSEDLSTVADAVALLDAAFAQSPAPRPTRA